MKEQLIAIGFDEREADIYIALCKLSKAGVTELLKHTQIERRSIYDVLERLVQKGRASFVEENGRRVYSPTNPKTILADIKSREKEFEKIIPALESLEVPSGARVEILKGTKGLMTIFQEIIESGMLHYSWGDISPLSNNPEYSRIVKKFLRGLKEKKIGEKIIYAKGDNVHRIPKGEYRSIDPKLISPAPTLIYGDITTQYIYTEPITIIKITSKEITQTNKEYFKHFWKIAKKD